MGLDHKFKKPYVSVISIMIQSVFYEVHISILMSITELNYHRYFHRQTETLITEIRCFHKNIKEKIDVKTVFIDKITLFSTTISEL